jgi:hypothetical protein
VLLTSGLPAINPAPSLQTDHLQGNNGQNNLSLGEGVRKNISRKMWAHPPRISITTRTAFSCLLFPEEGGGLVQFLFSAKVNLAFLSVISFYVCFAGETKGG